MKLNRRKFISGNAAVGALTFLPHVQAQAAIREDSYATLIDLTKCNGCAGKEQPLCITACRKGREKDFPKPAPDQLRDYWPQKKHEDWSDKRTISATFHVQRQHQRRLCPYPSFQVGTLNNGLGIQSSRCAGRFSPRNSNTARSKISRKALILN